MPANRDIPEVARIGALMTALILSMDQKAGNCRGFDSVPSPDIKCLSSWDALDWYEVTQDTELIDFLLSGTKQGDRFVRSLQSFVQWHSRVEVYHFSGIAN